MFRIALSICCCMLLSGSLYAALGGVPETPVPGRAFPQAWLLVLNDDWSPDDLPIERRYDDHRTAAFVGGLRMDRWLVFADYAIMTDRWTYPPTRVDELTISLGRLLTTGRELSLGIGDRLETAAGIGLRVSGDLGGDAVQNNFHHVVATPELELPYDDDSSNGLIWGSSEWSCTRPGSGDSWRVGVAVSARGVATTAGEAKASLAAHAVLYHRWLDAWVGLRQELRAGDSDSSTKNSVNDEEDGTWVSFGIAPSRWFTYLGGHNLATGENYGGFGIIVPMGE